MLTVDYQLPANKQIFFCSDMHLGEKHFHYTLEREKKIVHWLNSIEDQLGMLCLVGDIFDFWYESKYLALKGNIRLQGKLAELTDRNIPVLMLTGNHDFFMRDYITEELGVTVYHKPICLRVNGKSLYIAHGDGLGEGDTLYKIIKRIFHSKWFRHVFYSISPRVSVFLAYLWSTSGKKPQIINVEKYNTHLIAYANSLVNSMGADYYIFGHTHSPLQKKMTVPDPSKGKNPEYINLGEWIYYQSYGRFDGENFHLHYFE